jgi:hypothetical protein
MDRPTRDERRGDAREATRRPKPGTMDTMRDAIAELDAAGFCDGFRAEPGGLRALAAGRVFAPEELVVEDVRRFEGESDPDDMAIVFALRSQSGDVRGTFTTEYGAMLADPAAAAMMSRLTDADQRSRQGGGPARGAPPRTPKPGTMESISEAIARLEGAGFRDSFRAEKGGLFALAAQRFFAPESLVVEEVRRFEGESDPDDMAILFALRSPAGDVRGTFTSEYGPKLSDPESAEVLRKLGRPA